MTRTPLAPFAVLLLVAAPARQLLAQEPEPPAPPPAPSVEEPSTEVAFPQWLVFPGAKTELHLLDLGVRTKTIFAVKVYAFGLYLEARPAAKALAAWQDVDVKKRRKDEGLFRSILDADFAKGLRWVMVRDVDGADIAEAFQESLEPRLRALAKTAKADEVEAAKQALTTFKGYFGAELTEGTELVFAWQPGGRLVTQVGGKVLGEVRSRHLCQALFDVYLGTDPISADAKQAFADAVPAFVRMAAALPAPADEAAGG